MVQTENYNQQALEEITNSPKVQANLLELAKSELIRTLTSDIKSLNRRILEGEKMLEEHPFRTEENYKMSYAHTYTLKYERDWFQKQLSDLENN
jgi:hypothetical protein